MDLFEFEQKIADNAVNYINHADGACDLNEYVNLSKEYSKLLKQARKMTRIDDKVIMNLLAHSLEQQDKVSRRHRKEAALFRHDLRHVGNMVLFCMDSGDYEGARKLIQGLDENIHKIESNELLINFTGHSLVDSAIHHCLDAGKASDISVQVNVQRFSEINADPKELAVALSNALENAVNACKKIPDVGNRKISVIGNLHGSQYFIEVANTFHGEILFDTENRIPRREYGNGFGTQSILYFAQKYDALLEYEVENGWLKLQLLI